MTEVRVHRERGRAGGKPGLCVDVDFGSAFTAAVVTGGKRACEARSEATPWDPGLSLARCLEQTAGELGHHDYRAFLQRVEVVRCSTSLGTNVVLQQAGEKVGLLVSRGSEPALQSKTDGMPRIPIEKDLVIGIAGAVGAGGEVLEEVNEHEVRTAVKSLLDLGARSIVVSLDRSHLNPANEEKAREVITAQYAKHFLGAVPVIMASQLSHSSDDRTRTVLAFLSSYVRRKAMALRKAEEHLRAGGYPRPLLVVGRGGTVSRVDRTRAVDIIDSSAAAVRLGCLYWCRKYGIGDAVCMDIGATSFKISLLTGTETADASGAAEADVPLVDTRSINCGGETVVRSEPRTRGITLGPESLAMSLSPGGQDSAGRPPTVSDADAVLGYVDPARYSGERRMPDPGAARSAILHGIGAPAGLSTEAAAEKAIDALHEAGAAAIRELLIAEGQSSANHVMLAIGGGGPTHCCGIADKLGITRVRAFPDIASMAASGYSAADMRLVYGPVASRLTERVSRSAIRAHRPVWWEGSYQQTPVYGLDSLKPGNTVRGPAIIEGRCTTCVVPPKWGFRLDEFRNAVLQQG